MRNLVIDGEAWRVKVGNGNLEARSGPVRGGIKLVIPLTFVTGNTYDNIDRGRWKKTSDGMVTPGMTAKAIKLCMQLSQGQSLPMGGDWVTTAGRHDKNWRMSRT